MKKLFALLLSVILVCSMATVVFAAPAEGEIEISNATIGKTYTLYKLFDAHYDAEGDNATAASYHIKKDDPNFGVLFGHVEPYNNSYFNIEGPKADGSYQVTASKTDDEVRAYLQTLTGLEASETIEATSNIVTFKNVAPGYYYVTTNNGTTVTVTNVNPSAEIIDKNQVPTGTKKYVSKKNANDWKDDYIAVELMETYEYRLTIGTTPNYQGADKIAQYYLVDTYGDAIIPNTSSVKVVIGADTELTKGWCIHKDGTSHAVGADWATADADTINVNEAQFVVVQDAVDNKFTVTVPYMEGYTIDKATGEVSNGTGDFIYDANENGITVTYDAKLNMNAVIGNGIYETNDNKVDSKIEHESKDGYKTADIGSDTAHVNTYGQGITKIDGTTKAPLEGVEFALYSDRDYQMPVNVVATGVPGVYKIDRESTAQGANNLVTPENGKIVILGMDTREYFLRETKALPSYNLPHTHFLLKADTASMGEFSTVNGEGAEEIFNVHIQAAIENNKGALLPETGAMGTIIFTAVGSLLAIAAVVFMITRKKMSVYED